MKRARLCRSSARPAPDPYSEPPRLGRPSERGATFHPLPWRLHERAQGKVRAMATPLNPVFLQTKALPMNDIARSIEGARLEIGFGGRRTQALTSVERGLLQELFLLFSADDAQRTLENVAAVATYLWASFDNDSPPPPPHFDWKLIDRIGESQMVATFGILALAFGCSAEVAQGISNLPPRAAIQAVALLQAEKQQRSARHAANSRHDKPDGSRAKQNAIRQAWASGKYSSRDRCAEEECAALDMSLSTARKALRNTPDPAESLHRKG